jgi:hypothetical protein
MGQHKRQKMGNIVSLSPAIAEQMKKVPTVVDSHDWYPTIIELPADLCVDDTEPTYTLPNWQLDTKRSCKDYDVYKDAGWRFFKENRSNGFEHITWRYATRVAVPKGMFPNMYVLSRGRELKRNSVCWRY